MEFGMFKRLAALIAVVMVAFWSPLASAKTIKFGVFPSSNPEKLRGVMEYLGTYLTEQIGSPVEMIVTRDYAELTHRLNEGSLDLAWVGALTYVQVVADVPKARYMVTYVNRAVSTGTVAPYYRSLIVTAKDSDITSIADIKGKRFAFTDPKSTSGYAYPRYLLRSHGVDPDTDLAKAFFLKRHDRVIDALLHGAVDAGALADEVYYGVRKKYGDALRIVAESDPIPMTAIVGSGHLDTATTARITNALVAMPSDHVFCLKMREVFGWHAAGFQKHSDGLYDSVRAVYGTR